MEPADVISSRHARARQRSSSGSGSGGGGGGGGGDSGGRQRCSGATGPHQQRRARARHRSAYSGLYKRLTEPAGRGILREGGRDGRRGGL